MSNTRTNTDRYLCGIEADGKLAASFILYSGKEKEIAELTGKIHDIDESLTVVRLDSETYNQLIGNRGKEFRYKDGAAVEYIPPEPTAEELQAQALAALDGEYQAKFNDLDDQIVKAAALKNTELQDELIAERNALSEEYAAKRGEL